MTIVIGPSKRLRIICWILPVSAGAKYPILMCLVVNKFSMDYTLGQYDESCKREQVISSLSKELAAYECRSFKKTYCNLICATQRLCHYMSYCASHAGCHSEVMQHDFIDPRNGYIKVSLWKACHLWEINKMASVISRIELYVCYPRVHKRTRNSGDSYWKVWTCEYPFSLEIYQSIEREEEYPDWRTYFDGTVNIHGNRIGAMLISMTGAHFTIVRQLKFHCTNNIVEYEACIISLKVVQRCLGISFWS